MCYALESLIDGQVTFHDDWDEMWSFARLVTCHGGDPVGNVRVHELTRFDPCTFRSPHEPGWPTPAATYARILRAYREACA